MLYSSRQGGKDMTTHILKAMPNQRVNTDARRSAALAGYPSR
jgi:hypothetical protein